MVEKTGKANQSRRHPAGLALGALLRVLWVSVLVAVPTLGVWIASSLAAHADGPVWLVCFSGLLLFPILPLAWEGFARWRANRATKRSDRPPPRPSLTVLDRLVLRTLTINLLFVTGLVLARPAQTFSALSARGDWPIESIDHAAADRVRAVLFGFADRLEWLYLWANENEFADMQEKGGTTPDEQGTSDADATAKPNPKPKPTPTPTRKPKQQPDETPDAGESDVSVESSPSGPWPMGDEVQPSIRDMPDEAKVDIATVGAWIAEHEQDPFARVKAVHDFTAVHVAYDGPSYLAGKYPPQEAEHVFRTGVGVCAGYANLMVALGDAADTEIVWIAGYSRRAGGAIDGEGHAWNGARIEGEWYLIDATWDAGWLEGERFVPNYRTDYMFTPPDVFAMSHIPDDPDWQLRTVALTRGEFLRMPTLEPRFYANGFELVSPKRAQVASDIFELVLENPRSRYLLVDIAPIEGGTAEHCSIAGNGSSALTATCEPAAPGRYTVRLFDSAEEYGRYQWLGSFQYDG